MKKTTAVFVTDEETLKAELRHHLRAAYWLSQKVELNNVAVSLMLDYKRAGGNMVNLDPQFREKLQVWKQEL